MLDLDFLMINFSFYFQIDMSTSNDKIPADTTSAFGRFKNFLGWVYLQYLLVTALYMLEPWERTIFNIIAVCLLATCIYSLWAFIPSFSASALGSLFGLGGLAASGGNSIEL